ncbi:MAG: NADH-quinone oxidoreductase subunit C [Verrucomicrobiota bacterium]|nr:NADH-quinone oxidoreductase subunit C [Verrucomicrobiota bacterium]
MSGVVAALEAKFKVLKKTEFRGETSLTVEGAAINDLARFAKDELGFSYLIDISAVDHFGEDPRFEVVYELYQFKRGEHLRLKIAVSEDDLEVPSVSGIWPTADWHERETYDMFGIKFTGHPDLRRILMWEGYPYFPLRKDFPLAGLPSEMPDVAFTSAAPLDGGPFVTVPSTATTKDREPRSREMP